MDVCYHCWVGVQQTRTPQGVILQGEGGGGGGREGGGGGGEEEGGREEGEEGRRGREEGEEGRGGPIFNEMAVTYMNVEVLVFYLCGQTTIQYPATTRQVHCSGARAGRGCTVPVISVYDLEYFCTTVYRNLHVTSGFLTPNG